MGEGMQGLGGCAVSKERCEESIPCGKSGYVWHLPFVAVANAFAVWTETQVCAQLHLEEQSNLANGRESLHATTASAFIMHGLDLEDTQYVSCFPTGDMMAANYSVDVALNALPRKLTWAPPAESQEALPNNATCSAHDCARGSRYSQSTCLVSSSTRPTSRRKSALVAPHPHLHPPPHQPTMILRTP